MAARLREVSVRLPAVLSGLRGGAGVADAGSAPSPGHAVAAVLAAVIVGTLAAVAWAAGGLSALTEWDWRALRFTLWQAALSATLSALLAVPVARALARRRFRGRGLLVTLLGAPFILPVIVAIMGLIAVFGRNGAVNEGLRAVGLPELSVYGWQGVILAHVFFNLPLSVRLILQGWQAIPAERFRLAASLDFAPHDIARHLERPSPPGRGRAEMKPALDGLLIAHVKKAGESIRNKDEHPLGALGDDGAGGFFLEPDVPVVNDELDQAHADPGLEIGQAPGMIAGLVEIRLRDALERFLEIRRGGIEDIHHLRAGQRHELFALDLPDGPELLGVPAVGGFGRKAIERAADGVVIKSAPGRHVTDGGCRRPAGTEGIPVPLLIAEPPPQRGQAAGLRLNERDSRETIFAPHGVILLNASWTVQRMGNSRRMRPDAGLAPLPIPEFREKYTPGGDAVVHPGRGKGRLDYPRIIC